MEPYAAPRVTISQSVFLVTSWGCGAYILYPGCSRKSSPEQFLNREITRQLAVSTVLSTV